VRWCARSTEFLGPTDVMAVVHVANRAATQGLTANRERLLASVDRYRGGGSPDASLGMLKEVAVSDRSTTRLATSTVVHACAFLCARRQA
jgi:hypothetical protein